jgi:hypothetical protein
MGEVHLFGIRHHGPGSARRLLDALDAADPEVVLIEGPADLSEALPALGSPAMQPPVALLAYAEDAPEHAVFWPFAAYSPEYQAVRWALDHGRAVRFIDLPASSRLGVDPHASETENMATDLSPIARDPIGALARAAGYEDGESWWSDVIEENPDPASVFAAVGDAMTALRDGHVSDQDEVQREAHMRRAIAEAAKATDGPVAVVCGAWHVPALAAKVKAADDAAVLKGLAKARIKATWVPWTSTRLARASGYGAGVSAPGWYAHLWANGTGATSDTLWVARMAAIMRDAGDLVSTASLIETVRMTRALAALRQRPSPGFEEMRDAAISTLMAGESLPWKLIERELLFGNEVGEIPADLPLAPLLEDLQRQQKRLRMKAESLERELSLDLRSESGLDRSTLLHRLNALDVPWGKLAHAGKSRGTFRENWVLAWQPEYAVRLVEHLAYGPTIELAVAGRMSELVRLETDLSRLADRVEAALTAQLPDIAREGTERLARLAAETDDCTSLLSAVPTLVDTLRYGTARDVAVDALGALVDQLITQGAIALPYAARNLDREAGQALHTLLIRVSQAITIAERALEVTASWSEALNETGFATTTAPIIAGLCARLAYEAGVTAIDEIEALISRRLSRACPAVDSAAFFEGFFTQAGLKLVHDAALRSAVDNWLCALDEDEFIETLPLFRRVFSTLDGNERRAMLDEVLGKGASAQGGLDLAPDTEALWAQHLATLRGIFDREAT